MVELDELFKNTSEELKCSLIYLTGYSNKELKPYIERFNEPINYLLKMIRIYKNCKNEKIIEEILAILNTDEYAEMIWYINKTYNYFKSKIQNEYDFDCVGHLLKLNISLLKIGGKLNFIYGNYGISIKFEKKVLEYYPVIPFFTVDRDVNIEYNTCRQKGKVYKKNYLLCKTEDLNIN